METKPAPVGAVVAMWRYPVKSMQGEELNGAPITGRGLLGDRAYAIREAATGHIASAKHPRKWHKLFQCRAAFKGILKKVRLLLGLLFQPYLLPLTTTGRVNNYAPFAI